MSVTQLPGYGPSAPVPVFQWEAEFSALLDLYRERKPKTVLEVGTYHGGTLYHWLQNAEPGVTVVSLDSYAVGVDNRHLYDEWVPEGVDLYAYCGNSHAQDSVDLVSRHGPFEWVFIDAGHYYDEVLRDWELYGPLCEHGAVVFHDILPPTRAHPEIEVARLWEELRPNYDALEIVADRGAEWGGIGVLFK